MTTQQAEQKITEAGGDIKVFWEFMNGQTMGFKDGVVDVYDCDVERFIRYKCDPKNEPLEAWD